MRQPPKITYCVVLVPLAFYLKISLPRAILLTFPKIYLMKGK